MYSNKEIKLSLRKYIASTSNTDIDEKSVINLLEDDFSGKYEDVVETIKKIRLLFGVKRQIPDWLKMLTFRFVYHYLCDDTVNKSQEELLKDIGFGNKVFDAYSWNMYSPDMKSRQREFKPVKFPFTYAEVESNPIYVAMLHHLITESRVNTNTFIDVFGKMGFVPAFCANGYTHKLIFTNSMKSFLQYYYGLTAKPTKAYEMLVYYKKWLGEVSENEKNMPVVEDNYIENNYQDYITVSMLNNIHELDKDEEFYEYAILKFCNMCFSNPYWEKRNVYDEGYDSRFVTTDYSRKRIQRFMNISKEDFVRYAIALKDVELIDSTESILDIFKGYINAVSIYDDLSFDEELGADLKAKVYSKTPLLYVDAPKYGEYKRFNFDDKQYMSLLEFLLMYKGDWILPFKNYNHEREDYVAETYTVKDYIDFMKTSERPLFEYKYTTSDRNVRNGISFITTIDFDELTVQEFTSRYDIGLEKIDSFQKIKVN